MTLAVMTPLPLPEVGLSVSQTTSSLAVQLPFDVTVTDWLAGLEPPCTPVYVSDDGFSVIDVDAAATVKVTGSGTVVAPVALRVIIAL